MALVDPAPGSGASHVAAGMLAPLTEAHATEATHAALGFASLARWPAFASDLAADAGVDPGLRLDGTLAVAGGPGDLAELADLVDLLGSWGSSAELLDAREVRRQEPLLAPGVPGGLLAPGDHQVHNRLLVTALLAACERRGVSLVGTEALGVRHRAGRITGVELAGGGVLSAAQVVVALGARSAGLEGMPVALPVRPVKGQILRLRSRAAQPRLRRALRAEVGGRHVYLVPRADGEVVVGATMEEQGFDTTVTAGAVADLLDDALSVVPLLGELELSEASAGSRPGSPDNGPLLGRWALDGLLVATGHHRNGILLAPASAEAICQALRAGDLPEFARAFAAERFLAGRLCAQATAPPATSRRQPCASA